MYIVRCEDNSLYTGITNDIERRMREHKFKLKESAAYTKSHTVIALVALWTASDRSMASKLEYKIKKMPKKRKEDLILNPDLFEEYQVEKIKGKYFKKLVL